MGASFVADLLEALRDEALDALDPSRTGHAAPARALVTHNVPAVDLCTDTGLLAVYLFSAPHIHPRVTARAPGACQVVATAEIIVEVWRCVPTMKDDGTPFPTVDYEDSALALAVDLWCLLNGLYYSWRSGALTLGEPCQAIEFRTAQPLGPSGGVAGWRVPLHYTLADPAPAGITS